MISVINEGIKEHLKKHGGKYLVGAGTLAGAAGLRDWTAGSGIAGKMAGDAAEEAERTGRPRGEVIEKHIKKNPVLQRIAGEHLTKGAVKGAAGVGAIGAGAYQMGKRKGQKTVAK